MKSARVPRLRYVAIAATIALASVAAMTPAATAAPARAAQTTTATPVEPAKSFDPVDLTGKRILLVPYHLDNFNAGEQSWRQRFFESEGATVTIQNPNENASKQLTILESAIAADTADLIIWQPIDTITAPVQIKKIQDAGVLQILDFANVPEGVDGLNFSEMVVDFSTEYYDAAVPAGMYMKDHPELGPVQIAWMGPLPANTACNQREQGLIDGIKSVVPDAQVVWEGQAKSQAQANTKMTDFLTTGTKIQCLCRLRRLGVAGRYRGDQGGRARRRRQQGAEERLHDEPGATPPEVELLWNADVSLMGSVFQGAQRLFLRRDHARQQPAYRRDGERRTSAWLRARNGFHAGLCEVSELCARPVPGCPGRDHP